MYNMDAHTVGKYRNIQGLQIKNIDGQDFDC